MYQLFAYLLLFTVFSAPAMPLSHEQSALLPSLPELPRRLPRYWHDHVEKLRTGLLTEGRVESLSRDVLTDRFGSYHKSVAGICLFLPRVELESHNPLVFFMVHGTWAKGACANYHPEDETFRQLLGFAKELAYRQARPIEIVSFDWSGENSSEARERAGLRLRMLNESFYDQSQMYGPRWGYAHSHGGNVCNIASQDIHFDTLIYCGTPVVEGTIKLCTPLNVARLFNLYSSTDPWQAGGSYDRTSLGTFFSRHSNGREFAYQENKKIFNVRVQCNGQGPGHVSLKWLMPHFWPLIDVVSRRYQYHTNLDANVYLSPDKVDYNVDQELFAQQLPGKSHETSPIVTIRKELSLRDMLFKIKDDEQVGIVAEQLRSEFAFSEEQEKRFALDFRWRDIHRGPSVTDFMVANWREVSDLVMYYLPWLSVGGARSASLIDPVIDF